MTQWGVRGSLGRDLGGRRGAVGLRESSERVLGGGADAVGCERSLGMVSFPIGLDGIEQSTFSGDVTLFLILKNLIKFAKTFHLR